LFLVEPEFAAVRGSGTEAGVPEDIGEKWKRREREMKGGIDISDANQI
jgi:hypothetical protein